VTGPRTLLASRVVGAVTVGVVGVLPAVLGTATTPGPATASSPAGVAAEPGAHWQWPLPPPVHVVAGFDPPAQPWLPGQRGVDLAGRVGEAVLSAGDGVVGFVGTVARVGVVTVVSGPLRTTYEPVRGTVRRGQPVHAGERIGVLQLAGSQCLPAACLHWGLLRGSTYLDPLALLGLERVRLLPLGRAG
jgi:murein DD-endopeptidase MepM/ murein hydrolase activator NlpD